MVQTPADLFQKFAGVEETFSHLGETLASVASELRASGTPPPQRFLEELAATRVHFEELRSGALQLAQSLVTSAACPAEEIGSLKDLKTLLQSLSEADGKRVADEQIKIQALAILDGVMAIVPRDGSECPPLTDCQAKALELRKAVAELPWPNLHPDAVVLAHRRHPFAELLTLVERGDELDDDLWLLLKHAVAESFGKAVSLAAARGKLVLFEKGRSEATKSTPSGDREFVAERKRLVDEGLDVNGEATIPVPKGAP